MNSFFLQIMASFGAGLGTSLSPCVYPMIPITVGFLGSAGGNRAGGRARILGFFLGQVTAFTALGVVAVSIGQFLGFSSEIPAVQIGAGVALLAFAYFSFFDKLPGVFASLNRFQGLGGTASFGSALLLGASSAAIASPCTSPVVGGMLAAISQVENRWRGIFLMLSFSLGLAALFLLVGLGLAKASTLPKAGTWMQRMHKVSSGFLALGGLFFISKGIRLL